MTRRKPSHFLDICVPIIAILICLNAQASGSSLFSPPVTYASRGGSAVVVADVNGDGKPDLLVAGNGVGVLLANGDGTFQPVVNYGPGGKSVAVADVNNDGNLDLLVTGDGVSVLLGNGGGTFQAAVTYDSGGTDPWGVAVADVNADGNPDLLVANYISYNVSILLGKGDGTFQAATTYDVAGFPSSIVVADVNGDGKPDLLVGDDTGVDVLLGNGDGAFQHWVLYRSSGFWASSVAVADMNGDGKPDIVVANCAPAANRSCNGRGSVALLLGNGDGTFELAKKYPSGGYDARSIAVADIDRDGKLDVVVAHMCLIGCDPGHYTGPGVVGVLLGKGDGTLHAAATYNSGGDWAQGVALADVNADSKPDILVSNVNSGTVGVLRNIIFRITQLAVSTSGSPSFIGQPVTFKATVTPTYGTIPDGEQVTFYDGAMAMGSVPLAGGEAAYTTSSLSAKTHAIRATYAGDAIFSPSTTTVGQIVIKYSTTMALTSSPNPSTRGQPVTFTATVNRSGPYPTTGKVKFWDGTTGIGTAALTNGVATLSKSKLAVGTHPITAQYLSDVYNAKSTSPVVNQMVQ